MCAYSLTGPDRRRSAGTLLTAPAPARGPTPPSCCAWPVQGRRAPHLRPACIAGSLASSLKGRRGRLVRCGWRARGRLSALLQLDLLGFVGLWAEPRPGGRLVGVVHGEGLHGRRAAGVVVVGQRESERTGADGRVRRAARCLGTGCADGKVREGRPLPGHGLRRAPRKGAHFSSAARSCSLKQGDMQLPGLLQLGKQMKWTGSRSPHGKEAPGAPPTYQVFLRVRVDALQDILHKVEAWVAWVR